MLGLIFGVCFSQRAMPYHTHTVPSPKVWSALYRFEKDCKVYTEGDGKSLFVQIYVLSTEDSMSVVCGYAAYTWVVTGGVCVRAFKLLGLF